MGRDYSELPEGLKMKEYVKLGAQALKNEDAHRFGYLCICFAAEQNYPAALLYKSGCCISGKGTQKSEGRAIKYFIKALELFVVLDSEAIELFYNSVNKKEYLLRKLLELQKTLPKDLVQEIATFTSKCMRNAQASSLGADSSGGSDISDIIECAKAIRQLEKDKSCLTLPL